MYWILLPEDTNIFSFIETVRQIFASLPFPSLIPHAQQFWEKVHSPFLCRSWDVVTWEVKDGHSGWITPRTSHISRAPSSTEGKVSSRLTSCSFFSFSHQTPKGSCLEAVKIAIDAGYRHIDGAFVYFNEHEVGQAIREKIAEGKIKREDIFYCGKVRICTQITYTKSRISVSGLS